MQDILIAQQYATQCTIMLPTVETLKKSPPFLKAVLVTRSCNTE